VTKNGEPFVSGNAAGITFTPDDDGTYIVTLSVSDGTDSGSDTKTIEVTNVAPQNVTITGPTSGTPNSAVTLVGSATDPAGANDPLTFAWAVFKDGSTTAFATGSGASFSFTPDTTGSYRAVLTVSDGDGGSTVAEHTVAISDSAPIEVTITGPATAVRGQPLTFTGIATSPSGGTITYDWSVFKDDATTPIATGTGTLLDFTPIESGNYSVRLTATANGASTTETHSLAVRAVDIQADSLYSGGLLLAVGGTTHRDVVLVTRGLTAGTLIVTMITTVPTATGTDIDVTIALIRPKATGFEGEITRELNGNTLSFDLIHLPGTATDITRLAVFAQSGNDDITVASGVTARAWLFGGLGNDRLRGGGGHDVLVGGEGDDLLVGGNGRDLLIGGFGADRLLGDAHDDIMIAGYTAFDADAAALVAIMEEWTRTDADFATRVAHLEGASGGLNGAVRLLGTATGTSPATVHDDNAIDSLTGGSGSDWFLFNEDANGYQDIALDMTTFESQFNVDLDFINQE
jgi:PKD repeat protein